MDGKSASGPLMQGPLTRRIMGGNMKSKKKYFVLTARRLQSYKTQQDYENNGTFIDCIDLMQLQTARALTSHGSHKNAIELVTRSKSIVFQTTSPELTTKWIEALNKVMTLRFSVAGELPEEKEETEKIEQELNKRKSMKFWRNSRSASSQQSEEQEAMDTYGFLEGQDVEEEDDVTTDDVFNQEGGTGIPEPRPTSVTSSGVESSDYEATPSRAQMTNKEESEGEDGLALYDTPTARDRSVSVDEGIDDTSGDPLYQNLSKPRKLSTPAIDELRKLVGYETAKTGADEVDSPTEMKGIEQLRELLASMP